MSGSSSNNPRALLVIGAGPMGLAAAYFAAKRGYQVTLLEAGDRAGGMAVHFDFGGVSIERFYHFCCTSDVDTMALLDELGLPGAIRWVPTRMGYFVDGRLHPFGDPLSLLRFPALSFLEKLRYGAMVFTATKRSDWTSLDRITARDWFVKWCGQRAYDRLWRPLFELKFYEFADRVSAAWIWQRIKRLGKSRRSLFQEELGYIEGGSQTLVDRLVSAIEGLGGKIHLREPVERIRIEGNVVKGVVTAGGREYLAHEVISTVPLPHVPGMLRNDAPSLATRYEGFENIGVACVIHKLRKPVSGNFWVNISDPQIEIPGFVEFSNLRPVGAHIVYVPYYMPVHHEKFSWSDARLIEESFGYLRRVNPALENSDRIESHVGRLRYAQPVCTVNFAARLPPALTPVKGLQIADTSFYYPEDRGVSESIKFARGMVARLEDAGQA